MPEPMLPLLFTLNFVTTAVMVGVIWTIQLVHYPFFHRVDKDNYNLHMDEHREKISYIVIPVMLAELSSAISLVVIKSRYQSEFIAGLVLLLFIWISTAVLQVPLHSRLAKGYTPTEVQKLVKSNWIRTVLWSIRLTLLLYILVQSSFMRLL
jgi:hypothetical protein